MMKFKVFGSALALAVSLCFGSFAQASERFVTYAVCEAVQYGESMAKLNAELAYQADSKALLDGDLSADLVRDGHGFRQYSAMELALTSPAPSTAS